VSFFPAKTVNSDIFGRLLKSDGLFVDREAMRPSYMPNVLPHREEQINELASILVPALRGETPSNVFMYGKTGTGKTIVTKFVGEELLKKGKEVGKHVNFVYINCEVVDTQYRLLQNIANHFINEWSERIPFTGWPTDEVFAKLQKMIDKTGGVTVIILDEIDKLKGDEALYNLSRVNSDLKNAKVSIVGISNDLKFTEFLDPRVKSSLGEENMIFPPYDAGELQDILHQRVDIALKSDVVEDGVVSLCSALAAQEHGDARRALDLLRVSAEIAERNNEPTVNSNHVYKAKNKIEQDCVREAVTTLPTHSKLVLYSVLLSENNGKNKLTTGEVYSGYKELSLRSGMDPLTQRRVTDLISELDMLGLVNARVKSFGRRGRTKEIQSSVPKTEIIKTIEEDDSIEPVSKLRFNKMEQTTLI